ncbi:hypothetical protein Pcinc_027419 [Petrolisthes cinctipes]|uniref:Uncharacterized protein n=1 Tax=Petrolisthes cinctipes TaxID=88211 RepID=A0AAE1F454_PETCI|nr:hypothetical protein Pcinc_027419 [Petrolisthes cinctipes]
MSTSIEQHSHSEKSPQKQRYVGNTALSASEELLLCKHILMLSRKDFTFDSLGLRMFVKAYLDKRGIRVFRFKDNFPGHKWVKAFLKRHSQRLNMLMSKKPSDRIKVSMAIMTGFQEQLVSPIEAQTSKETQVSSCGIPSQASAHSSPCQHAVSKDGKTPISLPRVKGRQIIKSFPMRVCQNRDCHTRFRGEHTKCLTHSLCIQDNLFSPENCPVCSLWISQLLKLPGKDIFKNKLYIQLQHRWRRAREGYVRKGWTLNWRDPSLRQKLQLIQGKRKRLSKVPNLYAEKMVKTEVKEEDNKYGEKSQKKQENGKDIEGGQKDTGGKLAKGLVIQECLRVHTSALDPALNSHPGISHEFPKVVLKRLSLKALQLHPGRSVRCSSQSNPRSLQKVLPKDSKNISQKHVSKIKKNVSSNRKNTSNSVSIPKVTPKIISKNGKKMTTKYNTKLTSLKRNTKKDLIGIPDSISKNGKKMTTKYNSKLTSLKRNTKKDLIGIPDNTSKILQEIPLKNNNNYFDVAPEGIPNTLVTPPKILGGLCESESTLFGIPKNIPQSSPQSTREDYSIEIKQESYHSTPVTPRKNTPKEPQVSRELMQLRTKVKRLEDKLAAVEKDRRWLADMCAKKVADVRHLRKVVKETEIEIDYQKSENKKLRKKDISAKVLKEKYLSLLRSHPSHMKQKFKSTVNTGVQVSLSTEKIEAQQEILKSKVTQLPDEAGSFQETSAVATTHQMLEVKHPHQAAEFHTSQPKSFPPKMAKKLQYYEVAKRSIKQQAPHLQICQQKEKSQLNQNLWTIQQIARPQTRKPKAIEKLTVSLAGKSATAHLVPKSHTPKHVQLLHATQLTPKLLTPQLTPAFQTLQTTPTLQTSQLTPILQNSQPSSVLQNSQLTSVSQNSQQTTVLQNSQLTKVSHNSQHTTVSHNSRLSSALQNSQLTPVSHNSQLSPVSHNSQLTPVSQNSQLTPVSQNPQLTPVSQNSQLTPVSQNPQLTPVSQNSQLSPVSQKPQLTPVSQNSQLSPVSQKPQLTPISQNSQLTPVSQNPQLTPVSQNSQLSPVSQKSQLSPVSQNSQLTPVSQNSQLTPVSQNSQLSPVSQNSQLSPVSQNSQLSPVSQNSQLSPVSQNSQLSPVSQNSQLTPVSQNSQLTPVSQNSQLTPVSQNSQLTPVSQNSQLTPVLQNSQLASVSQTSQITYITNLQNTQLMPTVQMTQLAPNLLNPQLFPRVQLTQQEIENILIEGDLLYETMMESGIQVQTDNPLNKNYSGAMLPYTPAINRLMLKPVDQTILQSVHHNTQAMLSTLIMKWSSLYPEDLSRTGPAVMLPKYEPARGGVKEPKHQGTWFIVWITSAQGYQRGSQDTQCLPIPSLNPE